MFVFVCILLTQTKEPSNTIFDSIWNVSSKTNLQTIDVLGTVHKKNKERNSESTIRKEKEKRSCLRLEKHQLNFHYRSFLLLLFVETINPKCISTSESCSTSSLHTHSPKNKHHITEWNSLCMFAYRKIACLIGLWFYIENCVTNRNI